jgi:hypothetical protein
MKKNIRVFITAIVAVTAMLYIGASGISQKLSFGPFFIFIGVATAVGLSIDIILHIKQQIRKSNVRKLEP